MHCSSGKQFGSRKSKWFCAVDSSYRVIIQKTNIVWAGTDGVQQKDSPLTQMSTDIRIEMWALSLLRNKSSKGLQEIRLGVGRKLRPLTSMTILKAMHWTVGRCVIHKKEEHSQRNKGTLL